MKTPIQLLLILLVTASGYVYAEAGGPDFYRVKGVADNDILNMRSEANPHAGKVGEIPPGADCVRNLGCKGGLTLVEFTNLSKQEQAAIKRGRPRWCHVEYQGITGWVAGRFLAEGSCDRSQFSGDPK